MQEVKGLVSVVIPAYNAGPFIIETIQSIRNQTFTNWELWVINDGSSDETAQKVNTISDKRIHLLNQKNSGVSVARNKGLELSAGEFITFFDADDLMTPDFLNVRVKELSANTNIGFVGGWVETFPEKRLLSKAVAENPEKEIHFFDPLGATVPSNYLFRASVLQENKVYFNPLLSCSADRFFLLEIARHSKGKLLPNGNGKLLYRISESSMSRHITPELVLDYQKYYGELSSKNLLPLEKRREIKSRYLFSIASAFLLIKYRASGARLFFQSFLNNPFVFCRLFFAKILNTHSGAK